MSQCVHQNKAPKPRPPSAAPLFRQKQIEHPPRASVFIYAICGQKIPHLFAPFRQANTSPSSQPSRGAPPCIVKKNFLVHPPAQPRHREFCLHPRALTHLANESHYPENKTLPSTDSVSAPSKHPFASTKKRTPTPPRRPFHPQPAHICEICERLFFHECNTPRQKVRARRSGRCRNEPIGGGPPQLLQPSNIGRYQNALGQLNPNRLPSLVFTPTRCAYAENLPHRTQERRGVPPQPLTV